MPVTRTAARSIVAITPAAVRSGGAAWTEITDGMPISQVYKIGQSATVRDKCVNGYQDNGTSTFMGTHWQFTNGGDGMGRELWRFKLP